MNYEEYLKNALMEDENLRKEYELLEDEYIIFPQTIGCLTFYSKTDLFEWIETQQELNKKYIELGWST